MVVLNGTIEQIEEIKPEDSGLKDVVTSMRISDYDYNNYMVFYIGSIDLYEGDAVTVFGVPLSMGSYTNTMNGTTSCAVLAAGYAEKQISG